MKGEEYERYVTYKSSVLTLLVGILIGVLTNYIVLFLPQRYDRLVICIIGLFATGIFFVSRYRRPGFFVSQDIPREFVKDLEANQILFRGHSDVPYHRFIYLCNAKISLSLGTLFKPSKTKFDSLYSDVYSKTRFLPFSQRKHTQEVIKVAERLTLSEKEKKAMIDAVNTYHGGHFVMVGEIFDYMCVQNRLLRGRGVFFINLFEPEVACIVIPSLSCVLSRYYERYHALLERYLNRILNELIDDQAFKNSILHVPD
jgi:hypothetical protein